MSKQGIKEKTVKGVGWSAIDNVAQHAVSFVVSIVLARILSPDDYGLLGLIAIFTAVCTSLINAGFGSALIRKKEVIDDDYNTAFIVNLCISILLYLIIFVCSPAIASFFGRAELVLLTRVSSLGMIIGALAIVQQTRLTKRIDFKTQTEITLISSVISGIIGIVLAVLGCGVWSLVAQGLVLQICKTGLLWIKNHWTPRFYFSKRSFNELFGFGWKLMFSGVLDTIWRELYQVIIGKYYSPATLGQYTRAKSFSDLFSNNLTGVIQRVTYPVLSEIQDNQSRMVDAYRRIIKTTMFITAICMFSLGAISEPLIYCLIGPKWHDAARYLPYICIIGSFYPLHAINLNMLQVLGRSDLFLGLEIVKKVIALGPLFIGAFIGIMPMLLASIVVSIISYFLNSYFSGKFLGYSSWMQIKDVAPSYLIAFIIAVSVYFFKYLPISNWIILPIQLIVGIVVFFFICKQTTINEYQNVKDLVQPFLRKLGFMKKNL